MTEIDFELLDIQDEILYFQCTDELQSDAWKKARKCITGIIENYFKQSLEAHPDDPDGPDFSDCGSDRQTFELQLYRTNNVSDDGLSVAFTVKCKDEKYYLCCTEDKRLYFKKGDSPESINGDHSDIIFFQKQFSKGGKCFKFQSSLHTNYYLAVDDNCGKQILILKKSSHELDETQSFKIV